MTKLGIGIALFGMVMIALAVATDLSGLVEAATRVDGYRNAWGNHECTVGHSENGMMFVGFLLTVGGAVLAALWRYFDLKRIEG